MGSYVDVTPFLYDKYITYFSSVLIRFDPMESSNRLLISWCKEIGIEIYPGLTMSVLEKCVRLGSDSPSATAERRPPRAMKEAS